MKFVLSLLLIFLVGSLIRFQNLDKLSMSHPEFYVPGIQIPEYMTDPAQRSTVLEVIAAPFKIHHPHLPGHDLLMLGWTHMLGTNIAWMRASSALVGAVTLLIFYLFGAETTNRKTALLSVFILAFHGHHIFWSQMAKQWVLLGLLGILSSYLLSRLSKIWKSDIAILYLVCSVFGLWVDSYFWPVFAAQMLWVFCNSHESKFPGLLLNIQFIALLFAGPAFAYLVYFSQLHSHLSSDLFPRLLQMAQFGGIVIEDSTVKPIYFINLLIGLIGAFFLVIGLKPETQGRLIKHSDTSVNPERSWITMIIVTLFIVVVNYLLFMNDNILNWRRYFLIALFLPATAVICWLFFSKNWPQITLITRKICRHPSVHGLVSDLPTMMMVIPFSILILVHFAAPVLASFALVSLTPFFILVACRGIFRLNKTAQRFAIIGTAMLCIFSIVQYANVPDGDYKALAEKLTPQVADGDLMLVDNVWFINPIVYYFPPSDYELRPTEALLEENSRFAKTTNRKRIWLIDFLVDEPRNKIFESNIRQLSKTLKEVKRLGVKNGIAVLFQDNN